MPKDETTNETLKAAMLKSLLALHPWDVAAHVRNVKDELDFDGREAAASSSTAGASPAGAFRMDHHVSVFH